jgi:uncharacterized protein
MGELVAVVITGIAHLFFEEVLHRKGLFIALAGCGWGAYCAWRSVRHPETLARWGFVGGRPGAWLAPSAFGVVAIAALAIVGVLRGTFALPWHLLALLPIYPMWGLVQQFLLQGLIAGNLRAAWPRLHAGWITVVASTLFGLVHWPDAWLMSGTFLLGLFFTPMFLRWRSLWPLGAWHGCLGALTYFWVLGRDPWQELFGHT